MSDDDPSTNENVTISVDIAGEYEDVMAKLRTDESKPAILEPLVSDAEVLLETVQRIDGGTRSAIATALPEESSMSGDADAVVDTLQVLERYDLVTLEGNTWMPGPRLGSH
jgi:endonuclease/exonuclease/phosphatase (EEP) superfamily protein YafD